MGGNLGRTGISLPLVGVRRVITTRKERGLISSKGKYRDWLTEDGLTYIESWASDGLTDIQIAGKMGISLSSFYIWQEKYPEIRAALKRGKAPADRKVEQALYRRACGYDCEETVTDYYLSDTEKDEDGSPKKIIKNIRVTRKHIPPDTGAIAFWLKNRKPDMWREKREELIAVTPADFSLLDSVKDDAPNA